MNIRITQNALRFRLQTDELTALQQNSEICQVTALGGPFSIHITIKVAKLPADRVSGALVLVTEYATLGTQLCLCVTPEALEELVHNPKLRDGVEDLQNNPDGSVLKLALEVDLKPKR